MRQREGVCSVMLPTSGRCDGCLSNSSLCTDPHINCFIFLHSDTVTVV